MDRDRAATFISGRLLLPFVLLPGYGCAVAAALTGHLVLAVCLFIATLAFRYFVRASGQGFVLSRALADAKFYEEARDSGLIAVERAPAS